MGVKKIAGRWVCRWVDEDGRDHKKVMQKGETREDAEAFLRDVKVRIDRIKHGLEVRDRNPHGLTVSDVVARYLKGKDARTANAVTNHIKKTALGATRIERVTPERIRTHLGGLAPLPPTKGAKVRTEPLSAATRNHVRKHLVQVFKFAIDGGLLVGMANPAMAVKPMKTRARNLTTYTAAECARLVNAVDQPWRGILAVSLHGLRKGETWGLDVADVDLERNEIRVQRSHSKPYPKSGRARVVPIIPSLRAAVVEAVELATGRSVPLFPGDDPDHKKGTLLTRRRNERSSVEYAYHRAIRLAKVPRTIRFHDLRHTTATLLLQAGVPVAHVSKILGHASIALTSDTYGHLVVDDLHAAMARISFDLPAPRAAKVK